MTAAPVVPVVGPNAAPAGPPSAGGSHEPLGPWRRGIRETGLGLITLGIVVFLFVAYQLFGTNLTEEHNQSRLKQDFAYSLSHAAAPPAKPVAVPGHPRAGSPTTTTTSGASGGDSPTVGASSGVDAGVPTGTAIDHLMIPAISLDKFVVEGTTEADLSQGPGHYVGTALPGQVGNVAIAGHRTTYGAPFFRLNELKPGDDIFLTNTTGDRYTYQVMSSKVVSPSDVSVLDASTSAELTLTTCNPRFSATSRLVVLAKLTASVRPSAVRSSPAGASKGATAPARTTTPAKTSSPAKATAPGANTVSPASPTTANLGRGNSSARPPAIAYAAAVVALWVLTRLAINRSRRWRRLGAYVIGIGVCLIPLWFCFENVVRLLPQNI